MESHELTELIKEIYKIQKEKDILIIKTTLDYVLGGKEYGNTNNSIFKQ